MKRIAIYFLPLILLFGLNKFGLANYLAILYLIFYLPYMVMLSLNLNYYKFWEKMLLVVVVYFFVIVPVFYYIFSFFKIQLIFINVFVFLCLFNMLLFIVSIFINKKQKFEIRWKVKNVDWYFVFFYIFYILLHRIFFYYYRFIPEWDSYGYLIKIENTINSGFLSATYRELFNPSVVLLSVFSKVEPYKILSFWMILLQSSLLILVKLMCEKLRLSGLAKVVAYLMVFAFPVLNMEIDMVRPQNLFIIALPIVFYLIYRDGKVPNTINWLIIFIISMVGIKYHEFFFFVFTLLLFYLGDRAILAYKKHGSKKDRTIILLCMVITGLLAFILKDKIQILVLVRQIVTGILGSIDSVENWRWWFLSGYSTDGDGYEMGWQGLSGIVKYYGYYFSPAGLLAGLSLIYFYFGKKIFVTVNNYYWIILLLVFGIFAEVLPRMGYIFLPERFWLNISLILFFLSMFILKKLNKVFIILLGIFCVVGLVASVYVASQKKSLITANEFKSVEWIKNNTSPDSIFITQGGNWHFVNYFAGRKTYVPQSDYFLSKNIIDLNRAPQDFDSEIKILDLEVANYLTNFDYKNIGLLELNNFINLKRNTYLNLVKNKESQENMEGLPKYVLYSFDKFNNLYTERTWWMKSNFYGANLDKFNIFPLVYDVDGVKIWRIE